VDDHRVNVGWQAHPKRKKLQRRLGAQAVLSLMDLWSWAAQHRPSGDLAGLSDEDIALAVDYPGGAGEWVAALCEMRLLDGSECGRSLHNWAHHQPWVSGHAARSKAGKKAARKRWENRGVMRDASDGIAENTIRIESQCPDPDPNTDPKSISDPDSNSDPLSKKEDLDLEKQRASSASRSAPTAPMAPPVISIPVVGKDKGAGEYPITRRQIDEWHSAYPAVAIMQQLRNMREWCLANPERRKTPRGVRAFIARWLAKEQDRGKSGSTGNGRSGKPEAYRPPYHDNIFERDAAEKKRHDAWLRDHPSEFDQPEVLDGN